MASIERGKTTKRVLDTTSEAEAVSATIPKRPKRLRPLVQSEVVNCGDVEQFSRAVVAAYGKFESAYGQALPNGYQFGIRFLDNDEASVEMRIAVADWATTEMNDDEKAELCAQMSREFAYVAASKLMAVLDREAIDKRGDCRASKCSRQNCWYYHISDSCGTGSCKYLVCRELELKLPSKTGFPAEYWYSAKKRLHRAIVMAPRYWHAENKEAAIKKHFWSAVLNTVNALVGYLGFTSRKEVIEKVMVDLGGWDLVGCGTNGHAHAHLGLTIGAAKAIDKLCTEDARCTVLSPLFGRGAALDDELQADWLLASSALNFDLYEKFDQLEQKIEQQGKKLEQVEQQGKELEQKIEQQTDVLKNFMKDLLKKSMGDLFAKRPIGEEESTSGEAQATPPKSSQSPKTPKSPKSSETPKTQKSPTRSANKPSGSGKDKSAVK